MLSLRANYLIINTNILQKITTNLPCAIQAQNYATKDAGGSFSKMKKGGSRKMMGKMGTKILLPVETDTKKLVKYLCGSNIYKEGQDIELKPDSEYPDWLWELNLGPPPALEDLDPNTKAYWRRVRALRIRDANLRKSKPYR